MVARTYRIAYIAALGLWSVALFAPYYRSMPWRAHGPSVAADPADIGLILAEWGWLGPLALNLAWYANLLLIWIGTRMVRGHDPGRRLPVVGLLLACTALAPYFVWDATDGRFHPEMVSGPALWLWIAAFAVPAAVSRLNRA